MLMSWPTQPSVLHIDDQIEMKLQPNNSAVSPVF